MRHTQKHSMNPLLMIGHVVVILLLVVMVVQLDTLNNNIDGGVVAAPSNGGAAAPSAAQAPTAPQPAAGVTAEQMAALLEDANVKGDPDAPVTIVEYSDFECPFCARFYSDTLSQIEAQYIDTGVVKLAYKHFPLSFHPNAQKAGEAFECAADQDAAWEMHDTLFEKGMGSGVPTFKQYAADLGLDQAEFDDCLDSGKYATKVSSQAQEAQSVGVRGTPGFLINGQLVSGAQPFAVFQQAIEAARN
jgi:protein-disulfide isomerase